MAHTDRPRIVVHVSIPRVPAAAPADEGGPVCGWYESSWALRQGLAVQELDPADGPGAASLDALWLAAPAAPSAAWA